VAPILDAFLRCTTAIISAMDDFRIAGTTDHYIIHVLSSSVINFHPLQPNNSRLLIILNDVILRTPCTQYRKTRAAKPTVLKGKLTHAAK